MTFFALLCAAHGGYYAVTGIWPLLHMPSFIRVTGPKTDVWLVRMVAALALAIGLALLAATRESPHGSVAVLAVASGLAFGLVDLVFVAKRVIGPVYLLDAAAETVFVLGWIVWAVAGR